MLREFAPRLVIEVGAGYSTMVAAAAAVADGATSVWAIEPFPREALRQGFPGLERLIASRLQEVDPAVFEALDANDVLFIDSTHVSRMDSDVNHLLLRIVPRLRRGVLVHIHDIHLPWEYDHATVIGRKR
jgi:hypothetical protein